jgi:hypothetical protein
VAEVPVSHEVVAAAGGVRVPTAEAEAEVEVEVESEAAGAPLERRPTSPTAAGNHVHAREASEIEMKLFRDQTPLELTVFRDRTPMEMEVFHTHTGADEETTTTTTEEEEVGARPPPAPEDPACLGSPRCASPDPAPEPRRDAPPVPIAVPVAMPASPTISQLRPRSPATLLSMDALRLPAGATSPPPLAPLSPRTTQNVNAVNAMRAGLEGFYNDIFQDLSTRTFSSALSPMAGAKSMPDAHTRES